MIKLYEKLFSFLGLLRHPLLLILRVYWGWSFFQIGFEKLKDIQKPIAFFAGLGIPHPTLSAYLVGGTETIGGLLLIAGFLSRLACIPLITLLMVALFTAHLEATNNILQDPKVFLQQAPIFFLNACLWVMIAGPGCFSVDAVLKKLKRNPVSP